MIADGQSDWPTFAREAERLIRDEKVSVIFGCWTSASRKSVKPVVERHHHLLFYPMAYEGLEESPNIVYTGAAPNQQVIPAVKWSYDRLKARKYFLAGSDYIWPHAVNAIARDYIGALGAEVVGEEYVLYGSTAVDALVDAIKRARPDVVISTVVGDTNLAFYRKLAEAGLGPKEMPVISFSIAEDELRHLPVRDMVGDYAAWNYFQSLDSEANREFVRKFKARYGGDRVTSDVIAAAYNSVRLWAQAVEEAETDDVAAVIKAVRRQSMNAPGGDHLDRRGRPCTPGGRSTSAGSAATASSTSSGARRRRSARSRSPPRGRSRAGRRSWTSCTGPGTAGPTRAAPPTRPSPTPRPPPGVDRRPARPAESPPAEGARGRRTPRPRRRAGVASRRASPRRGDRPDAGPPSARSRRARSGSMIRHGILRRPSSPDRGGATASGSHPPPEVS